MVKIIKHDGENYKLEFDLDSLCYMEDIGFDGQKMEDIPFSMFAKLVNGAFHKNHPGMTISDTNRVYMEGVAKKDKKSFSQDLMKMYMDVANDVMGEDEGNADGTTT